MDFHLLYGRRYFFYRFCSTFTVACNQFIVPIILSRDFWTLRQAPSVFGILTTPLIDWESLSAIEFVESTAEDCSLAPFATCSVIPDKSFNFHRVFS